MSINDRPPIDTNTSFSLGTEDDLSVDSFDFDALDDVFGADESSDSVEELSELKRQVKEETGEGDLLVAEKANIANANEANQFMSPKKFCQQNKLNPKQFADKFKKGDVIIGHLAEQKPGEKRRKLHVPEAAQAIVEEYGCEVIDDDGVIHELNPDDLEVEAWTPEQMERINKAANNAFQSLARTFEEHQKKIDSGDDSALKAKRVSHRKEEKPLVSKDRFPDFEKLKAERDQKARKKQRLHHKEVVDDAKRKKEQRESEEELKLEDREADKIRQEEKKWDIKQEQNRS